LPAEHTRAGYLSEYLKGYNPAVIANAAHSASEHGFRTSVTLFEIV